MEWVSNLSGLPEKDPAAPLWVSRLMWPGEKCGGAEGLGVGVMTASKKDPAKSPWVSSRSGLDEKVPGVQAVGVEAILAG